MSNLTIYEGNNFDVMQRVARALAASGFFDGDIAKAITKVMAGQELGLPPFASMSGIHVISGKPVLGANLIASLIKSHPRYDYRVTKMEDTEVIIVFFENGQEIGKSSFTIKEAQKAGTKNLEKFPRNMLFARAISNGARWYCPDIFGGSPVYTPDEMGMSVDEDGYIDGDVVEQSPTVATVAPYTYGDGEIVAASGRDIFDKFEKWHGRIPASRDEMAAWYKQKDGQEQAAQPAPEAQPAPLFDTTPATGNNYTE